MQTGVSSQLTFFDFCASTTLIFASRSVMNFVGYDYRKERQEEALLDQEDGESLVVDESNY